VLVESKLFPEFICPPDTAVVCNGQSDVSVTGMPIITSCEGSVDIDFEDFVDDNGKCDSNRVVITRTWTIVDESGNRSTCDQTITLLGFDLDQVMFPENFDGIDNDAFTCAQVGANPSITEPRSTGFITLNGLPIGVGEIPFCDLTYGFSDEILQGCGGSYEILRTWTIRDLCSPLEIGVNPRRHLQSILVWDMAPPVVISPDDLTLSTLPDECGAVYSIPVPTVTGECSDFDYLVNVTAGNLIQLGASAYVLSDIPVGETTVQYILQDDCGNVGTHEFVITVEDNQSPTAVCDENTVISITIDGTGLAFAETFDDGSHDNCNEVFFKVLKEDELCGTTNGFEGIVNTCITCDGLNAEGGDDDPLKTGVQVYFDDEVKFCCDEVGEVVQVVMRVFEVDPGEGPVDPARMAEGGDLWNTFNDCVVNARVQDKLPPVVVCPPNITVACEFEFDMEAITNPDDRTFGRVVPDGVTREEVVVPGHGDPSRPDNFVWGVEGVFADNCVANLEITVNTDIECGQGTLTRVFTVTDGFGRTSTCSQRISFIDADPFDESNIRFPADREFSDLCFEDIESDPSVTGEPVIIGDVCADILTSFEDEVFTNDADACLKILRTWKVLDWCQYDEDTGAGIWTDVQVIKLSNDVAPVITGADDEVSVCDSAATACEGFIELTVEATDDCSDDVMVSYQIDAFNDGTIDISSTGSDASGVYPFGRHRIIWTATDGCGNETSVEQFFELQDCKKPSPKCFSGLVTVIMPAVGEVTIWASDFDAGSDDNCGDVTVSFSTDVDDIFRSYTCDELGTQIVEIYVTDEAGNQDFCETFIFIQDNNNICDSTSGAISGIVNTEYAETVEGAEMDLSTNAGVVEQMVTANDGEYLFENIPWHQDYEISGFKNDDPKNGVSTFDIVQIQKHLLGIELFDSPYKYMAADANNSNTVSALDIVDIRKLLLGVYDEYPENTSWRFTDSEQTFNNPASPWPFDELIIKDDFDEKDSRFNNFIAVKIGDIDGSAEPNSLVGTEDRTDDGVLVLTAQEAKIPAGESYEVEIAAEDFTQVLGFQNTWTLAEGVEFSDVISGAIAMTDDNYSAHRSDEGLISMSWSDANGVTVADGEVLFTIVFTNTSGAAVRASDVISITDELISTESYTEMSSNLGLAIDWRIDEPVAFTWALEQNTPNPFDEETLITFTLAELSDVDLTVFDSDGKTVTVISGDYDAGTHQVKLERKDLNASGVLVYELRAVSQVSGDEFTDAKMMIVVD